MGRKKKVEAPKEEEPVRYEWADLVIQCKCGNTQTLNTGMNDGLQLLLFPTDKSFVKLMCDKCDSELTLRLIEGVKPEDVNVTETSTEIKDEGVPKENKQEEIL